MKPLGNLINSVAMKLGINLCKTSYRSNYQGAETVRSIVHSTSEHVLCKDELKACIITETIIGGCVFSLIPRFFQSHSQPPPQLSAREEPGNEDDTPAQFTRTNSSHCYFRVALQMSSEGYCHTTRSWTAGTRWFFT